MEQVVGYGDDSCKCSTIDEDSHEGDRSLSSNFSDDEEEQEYMQILQISTLNAVENTDFIAIWTKIEWFDTQSPQYA